MLFEGFYLFFYLVLFRVQARYFPRFLFALLLRCPASL